MAQFQVSARKYRPQSFDQVVGQAAIIDTLNKAIERDKIPQALLFAGQRGVGKTTCARIFARKVNEAHLDSDDYSYNVFELDAASNNSVEEIRALTEQVRFPPQRGKYKVYIIDEVHMLSQAAFNAFLKTLEEPPEYVIFVLATTEKHKVLPTILSRCQIFDFRPMSIHDTISHFQNICKKEGVEAEHAALELVARKAEGAMRDALSILDQLIAVADGGKITFKDTAERLHILDHDSHLELVNLMSSEQISAPLIFLDKVVQKGFDLQAFLQGLMLHFRHLLMCKEPEGMTLLEFPDDTKVKFDKQASGWSVAQLISSINVLNEADVHFKSAKSSRLHIEIHLLKIMNIKHEEALLKKKALTP